MSLSSVRSEIALRRVLRLELLQAFDLVGLQPAELLPPPIIGNLAHPDLANGVGNVLSLRDKNIDLPQLRDDLFRLMVLPRHLVLLDAKRHTSGRTTSKGGGSLVPASAGAHRA